MRLQHADNVRIVRVPCTGKVDVRFLLAALESGADGVLVAGCLEGDCHYLTGNLRAWRRVRRVQGILEEIGIEPSRVEMVNLSSGQGPRFVQLVTDFVRRIAELGPAMPERRREAARPEPQENAP